MEKLKKNWQFYVNIYVFLNFLGFCGWQAYSVIAENRLNFVEVSFIIHNIILVSVVLVRSEFKAIDKNWWHQLIAFIAFFSGAFFMGQPQTSTNLTEVISQIVIMVSNILGLITLLNLGKSFGVMISYRNVKTKGLYSYVRHPMYGTDILLRIGFLISHFTWYTIIAFVLSTACYIYRAILEERFLRQQPEYELYMQKVKYRFIPLLC